MVISIFISWTITTITNVFQERTKVLHVLHVIYVKLHLFLVP